MWEGVNEGENGSHRQPETHRGTGRLRETGTELHPWRDSQRQRRSNNTRRYRHKREGMELEVPKETQGPTPGERQNDGLRAGIPAGTEWGTPGGHQCHRGRETGVSRAGVFIC